ncbi:MAG: hypothetical protein NC115_10165 [Bacteroidales bacterium]|nr:hypothetical protein [Bacteroidales bacterium]
MKRNLLFMAKAMTIIAAMALVACSKDNKPSKNHGDDDDEDTFQGLVTIDGSFSDWNGLDCATATLPDGAMENFTALKTFKLSGDGMYIYIYAEIDKSVIDMAGDYANPVDIYINSDNKDLTGGIFYLWDPLGYEYLIENCLLANGEFSDWSEPMYFKFTGEDGTDVWATNPPAREELSSANLCKAAGKIEGDVVKWEMRIMRALIPGLNNTINVGLMIQSTEWSRLGSLPVGPVVDGQETYTAPLQYTLPDAI